MSTLFEHDTSHESRSISETAKRLQPFLAKSALYLHDQWADSVNVYAKAENETVTGSYKVHGALNWLLDAKSRGFYEVTTSSAGNHAAGVAYGAKLLGMKAYIGMPEISPQSKRDNVQALGGTAVQLEITGRDFNENRIIMMQRDQDRKTLFSEAFNHIRVIEGQAVVTHEILQQNPDIDRIFVQVGGGGLLAGAVLAVVESGRKIIIHPVQLAGNDSLEKSLAAGKVTDASQPNSLCEGISVLRMGDECLAIVQANPEIIGDIITVDNVDIGREVFNETNRRQMLEPDYGELAFEHFPETTGLVSLAGARKFKAQNPVQNENWAVIISGSNTDPERESRAVYSYLETQHTQK